MLQNNSGSLCVCDIASQIPPDKITTGPITARTDTREMRLFGFSRE